LVTGTRFIPVFQGTARETSGVRRLDLSMRTGGWDTTRGDTVKGGKDAVLATDGTKTV